MIIKTQSKKYLLKAKQKIQNQILKLTKNISWNFFEEYVTRPQLIVLFIFSTQLNSHNFSILFLLFPGSGSRRNCSKVWCCPGYFPYKKRKKRKAFFVAACQKASRELLSQIEIEQCAVIYIRLFSFNYAFNLIRTIFPHLVSALNKFHPLILVSAAFYQVINWNIAATIWIGSNFQIQKRIVFAETIWGNMVYKSWSLDQLLTNS